MQRVANANLNVFLAVTLGISGALRREMFPLRRCDCDDTHDTCSASWHHQRRGLLQAGWW
eukprot:6213891-Pleurochrysis_carterae.AAC.3